MAIDLEWQEACAEGCLTAYKESAEGAYGVLLVGLVEPALTQDDVDRVWTQIAKATESLPRIGSFPRKARNVVLHIVNRFDSTAKNSLCDRVQGAEFARTPILVLSTDGTVLCYSRLIKAPNEALLICAQLGFHCRIPEADSA